MRHATWFSRAWVVAVSGLGLLCALAAGGAEARNAEAPGGLLFHAPFDGSLEAAYAAGAATPVRAEQVRFEPGRAPGRKGVWAAGPLAYETQDHFRMERGTVELWIRPDFDFDNGQYHCFFDVPTEPSGSLYLYKSGSGGGNRLFLYLADAEGRMHAVHARVPWKAGEWLHLTGAWDLREGLSLWVNGERVARQLFEKPVVMNPPAGTFFVGSRNGANHFADAVIADLALYASVRSDSERPTARALNFRGENQPLLAVDGVLASTSAWTGQGAPNWLEITLPRLQEIARVVVYPGDLRYASLPSTEASPGAMTIQGYVDGQWQDVSDVTRNIPYTDPSVGVYHAIALDFDPPLYANRFRLHIHELQDQGHRISGGQVPENERVVTVREVKWFTAREVERERELAENLIAAVEQNLAEWAARLEAPEEHTAEAGVLKARYLEEVKGYREAVASLLARGRHDDLVETAAQWENLRASLAPWKGLLDEPGRFPAEHRGTQGERALLVEVDPGESSRSFYPVSVPLDLAGLEAIWSVKLNPHAIRVVPYALDDASPAPFLERAQGYVGTGKEPFYSPSRFDRATPSRGTLTWSMRDASQNRFLILFEEADPDSEALDRELATIGDGDSLFYDRLRQENFPVRATSMAFVDWLNDGRTHLLVGTQMQGIYIWQNTGNGNERRFGHDYFEVLDRSGKKITTHPERPDFGFNCIVPADANGDGQVDFFVQSILTPRPRIFFHQNLGPAEFPVMSERHVPEGLATALTAFGDLTGNGLVDAIQAVSDGQETFFELRRGLPPEKDGMPRFERGGDRLTLGGEPFSRIHGRLHPTLADLNGNGLPDLTFFASDEGLVYVSEHVGTSSDPVFAAPYRIKQGDRDLVFRPYGGREAVMWGDATGNGLLDLITTGGAIRQRIGEKQDPVRVGPRIDPRLSRQQILDDFWGIGFDFVDWNGNGFLDQAQINGAAGPLRLTIRLFEDGYFREEIQVPVDENRDWFGCPDTTEYQTLFSNLVLVDINGNGHKDLFATTEHSWRFGYIHYYENLGDGTFAAEQEFRPGGAHDYVTYTEGVKGQGAHVTEESFLDYLSYPSAGRFDPAGGALKLWFKPDWGAQDGRRAYLFYTGPDPHLSLNAQQLLRYYRQTHEGLDIAPGFALYKDEDDALCFQLWEHSVRTAPMDWKAGQWYRLEAFWGEDGVSIRVDGEERAREDGPVAAGGIGVRMHIGSRAVRYMQPMREYPSRRAAHPVEWIHPANGVLDEFEILDADGNALLHLSFDGHTDGSNGEDGRRLRVGYRSRPDFADLTGNGLLDMVMMLNDGTREANGRLVLFPNTGTRTSPAFSDPVPLRYTDGSPMEVSSRSHISLVDWNGNGLPDLILANHGGSVSARKPTAGIQLFLNEGTRDTPLFARRIEFERVHGAFHISHDPRAKAADFTGDGQLDIAVSSDPGRFFFTRSFLDEPPPTVRYIGLFPMVSPSPPPPAKPGPPPSFLERLQRWWTER